MNYVDARNLPCCYACGAERFEEQLQEAFGELYCSEDSGFGCYVDLAERQAAEADDEYYGGSTPTLSERVAS